ncbi:hypothetical protein [Actinophytocola sediminis]
MVGVNGDGDDPGQAWVGRGLVDDTQALGRVGFVEAKVADLGFVDPVPVAVGQVSKTRLVLFQVVDRGSSPKERAECVMALASPEPVCGVARKTTSLVALANEAKSV